MKIAFLYNSAIFNRLFLSLALLFKNLGHEVMLINPRYDLALTWKFHGLNTQELKDYELHKIKDLDRVIVWNGLNIETGLIDAFEKYSGAVWYLENGYFSKTLQCNRKGVNASADFAKLAWQEQIQFQYPKLKTLPHVDIKIVNRTFRDLVFYLFGKLLYEPQFIFIKSANILLRYYGRIKNFYYKLKTDETKLKGAILVILQVNNDTQITHNSPFKDVYDFLDTLLPVLKNCDMKIVLKEHPTESAGVTYHKYKKMFPGLDIVRKINLEKVIRGASLLININSSVGMQALSYDKKVCVFGHSFYSDFPNVLDCLDKSVSCQDIKNFLAQEFAAKDLVDKYIKHFKDEIFIKGDWRHPDREFLKELALRILA